MSAYTNLFTTDADGWYVPTPSGTPNLGYSAAISTSVTMCIYVAKNGNDTTGDGSPSNPYLTIAKGKSRLRNGSPDWLLLRKADTWTDEVIHGSQTQTGQLYGKSASEPMLIMTYSAAGVDASHPRGTGTGARPVVETDHTLSPFALNDSMNGNYVAVIGIELYCYTRNPADARYIGKKVLGAANNGAGLIRLTLDNTTGMSTGQAWDIANVIGTTEANTPGTFATITVIDSTHVDLQGSTFANAWVSGGDVTPHYVAYGIDLSHGTDWNVFEDFKVSYYWGIRVQTDVGTNRQNTVNNLYFRRGVCTRNYGNMGMFLAGYGYGYDGVTKNSIVLYQIALDRNTWAENWFGKGKIGTLFSHNLYAADVGSGAHNNDAATPTYEDGPMVTDGLISVRDSVGSHFKAGGILTNNFWGRNGGAFDMMYPSTAFECSVTGDVFAEFEAMSEDALANAQGILLRAIDPDDSIKVSVSGDTITFPYDHPFTVGAPFLFNRYVGDAPPSPFVNDGTRYYVVEVPTSTTVKISATLGGAPITASTTGTPRVWYGSYGTVAISRCLFANYAGDLSQSNLNGYAISVEPDAWTSISADNNIIYKFGFGAGPPAASALKNGSTYPSAPITFSGNDEYQGQAFDNVPSSKYAYLDNLSMADYAQRHGVGTTHDDLCDAIAGQTRDTWRSDLTAASLNAYFKQGRHRVRLQVSPP